MKQKPFLTIDQQIELLSSRGMIIPDKAEARRVLLGTNYYNIINGYKDQFVYMADGKERFLDNVTLIHMQLLYTMDSAFRMATLTTLLRAESVMKTAIVHAFCSEYGGADSYLENNWYRPVRVYQGKRADYTKNRNKLRDTLKRRHDNDWHKEYVQHYLDTYGCVPLWVLAPCLSFGNIASFFDFQVDRVQNKACSYVCEVSGKRMISASKMREAFNIMTPFRNTCAHNERFYCAKVGPRGNWGFGDLLNAMQIVLTDEEVGDYVRRILAVFDAVGDGTEIPQLVLNGMGVTRVELELLASRR